MKQILLIVFSAGLFLGSCDAIVVENITKKLPSMILPVVNDTIESNPVHFKWEEMEGAKKYHLRVASPSFNAITTYVLDTMITDTDFYYDLDSSEFELMLTGTNEGYDSKTLGPIKFWVGTNASTPSDDVVLAAPINNAYVNETFSGDFSWIPVANALNYEYSIRNGSSFGTGTIVASQNNIVSSNYPLGISLTEGEYHWGVKAYFANNSTDFSLHTLYVDTANPVTPVLGTPTNSVPVNPGLISFTWNNGTDNGIIQSPIHSVFEIATDAGFTNLIPATSPPIDLVGTSIDLTLTSGNYYWRVGNYDEAGNVSAVSPHFSLIVQ